MSYYCQGCEKTQPPRTRRRLVLADTEEVVYPFRKAANSHKKEHEVKVTDDPGGRGWQIVQEVAYCPECFAAFNKTV